MAPKRLISGESKPKRKIVVTTIDRKKEIIDKYEKGARITDLAAEYCMAKSTVATILKNKEAIKGADVAMGVKKQLKRPAAVEEMEKKLFVWINERQMAGDFISEGIICAKARRLYGDLICDSTSDSSEDFKASKGWYGNFKKRTGIQLGPRSVPDSGCSEELGDSHLMHTFDIDQEGKEKELHGLEAKNPMIKSENAQLDSYEDLKESSTPPSLSSAFIDNSCSRLCTEAEISEESSFIVKEEFVSWNEESLEDCYDQLESLLKESQLNSQSNGKEEDVHVLDANIIEKHVVTLERLFPLMRRKDIIAALKDVDWNFVLATKNIDDHVTKLKADRLDEGKQKREQELELLRKRNCEKEKEILEDEKQQHSEMERAQLKTQRGLEPISPTLEERKKQFEFIKRRKLEKRRKERDNLEKENAMEQLEVLNFDMELTKNQEDNVNEVPTTETKDVNESQATTTSTFTVAAAHYQDLGTEDFSSPFPHLDNFYGPVISKKMVIERGRVLYRGSIMCKQCKARLSFNTISLYNLKSHYQHQHQHLSKDLSAAIGGRSIHSQSISASSSDSGNDSRTNRLQLASIETSFTGAGASKFNSSKAKDLLHRCMIDEMLPARLMESPTFTAFTKYLNPKFKLPSRQTFMRTLKKKVKEGRAELTSILAGVNYVAITADCWTAHNRTFLGMTAHWIEPADLKRKKAILTCCELSVAHTYAVLGNTIQDVHQKFDIENKVVSLTTDNGTNFMKTFDVFGIGESADPNKDHGQQEDSDKDPVDIEEDETEEREEVQPVELANLIKEQHRDMYRLPNHRQCAVHTLSLLATCDVEKVPSWTCGQHPYFTKVIAKAQALWNKQNRMPTTAATIKRDVGRKLKTPNITCWNSLYDSLEVLNELLNTKMSQINRICIDNNIASFNLTDKDILSEYLTVMKPMSTSLDKLQSEKEAYMGVLLPTLYVLKDKLENLKNSKTLRYAQPMVEYILDNPMSENKRPKGFKARFSTFFDEMDLLLAVAIHPYFKLPVVHQLNPGKYEMVRNKLVNDISEEATKEATDSSAEEDSEEDDFFEVLLKDQLESHAPVRLSDKLGKDLDTWCTQKNKTSKELEHDMFPAQYRTAWVEVFLKYNTAIPCSAGVERVFSQGSDMMKPKRFSFTFYSFEQFVFLKGNMDLLRMEVEKEPEELTEL